MSTSRGSGGGNGSGVQPIPTGARKVVQSLKEIVNCSEAEIYATLKDCNMDPNEAVNRLLSQDPFHEVKSKREKKKEGKDNSEPRSRSANNTSSRGSRSGADRHLSRGAPAASYSASEYPLHGKSTYKKENGSSSLSSAPAMSGNTRSRGNPGLSDGFFTASKGSWLPSDDMPSLIQPASGHQSAWVGVPGQVSMADIVRMGRPHNKTQNIPNASHHNIQDPSTTESLHNLSDYSPKVHQLEASSVQDVPTNDEWPSIEKQAATNAISVPEYSVDSELHPEASSVSSDSINHEKAYDSEHHEGDHDFEHHEDEEVGASPVTTSLQQLSVTKDNIGGGNAPSVVIPDHLQVQTAECSHLSFGSFGSGMSAAYSSGSTTSVPVKNNWEEARSEADISSAGHLDARRSEYYVDDSLRNAPDISLFPRNGASGESYDASSASHPEELKSGSAEVAHGNQYIFTSSRPDYSFDDSRHLNATFNQTSSQMQNIAPFSNVMHSHSNSIPSNLLTANVHPTRESDLQYSPFPVTPAMSAKYGNSVSSMGVSAIPMPEALRTAGLPSTQQALPGTSVATGPPLPQHQLAVHPYSQPTVPLAPFTNLIGYPFLPQSYTYMPSAFQQSLSSSSNYHQSALPQYKSSVSASSSLPQSAAVASGYGAFGGSNTIIPGSYQMNLPAAASGTTLSYDDLLSSQYKESLLSLQQTENSAMWLHGLNSRTMPAVPANTYYNFQGQNQQQDGFRQGQQQSQNYVNFYQSQTGISLDQHQNPRDGSQGQPKQSQIWPNSY